MSGKFKAGDWLKVNADYVNQVIAKQPHTNQLNQTIERLGELDHEILITLAVNYISNSDLIKLFYIKVVPLTTTNPAYNSGQGVVVYFKNEDDMYACFDLQQNGQVAFDQRSGNIILPDTIALTSIKTKAIFTIVGNGNQFIKIWHKYYRKFFQLQDIYILDCNSTDNSLDGLDCQIVKHDINLGFSASAGNQLINSFKTSLLKKYQIVVFSDYDEILFHPHGLNKFIDNLAEPYVTASGFEIIQKRKDEPSFDFQKSVLSQRSYWVRNALYDKSLITSIDFQWEFGCHTLKEKLPNYWDYNLYLLHLNKMDFQFLTQLHQKLHNEKSIMGGLHHLLGKELDGWWFLAEKDAVMIPKWIKEWDLV